MAIRTIQYITGDATAPGGADKKLLVHLCNSVGSWGAGFVLAISRKWKKPEREYRQWDKSVRRAGGHLELGEIQSVEVAPDLTVVNIIGQKGLRSKLNTQPIDYQAVERGLDACRLLAEQQNASVHMPRIGTNLAGGDWRVIEPIIKRALTERGIDVTVYDLPVPQKCI